MKQVQLKSLRHQGRRRASNARASASALRVCASRIACALSAWAVSASAMCAVYMRNTPASGKTDCPDYRAGLPCGKACVVRFASTCIEYHNEKIMQAFYMMKVHCLPAVHVSPEPDPGDTFLVWAQGVAGYHAPSQKIQISVYINLTKAYNQAMSKLRTLHHHERLKQARKHYWGRDLSQNPLDHSIAVTTPCRCSCHMCGNRRKHLGPTLQERRAALKQLDDTQGTLWTS